MSDLDIDSMLNVRRFSGRPTRDVVLNWWNKRIVWEVRRESTEHRVAVTEMEIPRWDIHIKIAMGISLFVLLCSVLVGSMPLQYTFFIGLILVILVSLLIFFEQKLAGSQDKIREITIVDMVLWSAVMERVDRAHQNSPKAQKKRFREAIDEAQRLHKIDVKQAKTAGETEPEYVKVEKSEHVNPNEQFSKYDIQDMMTMLLSTENRSKFRDRLISYCDNHEGYSSSWGTGVVNCGCTLCEYNAEHGITPDVSGVAVAVGRRKAEDAKRRNNLSAFLDRVGVSRSAEAKKQAQQKKASAKLKSDAKKQRDEEETRARVLEAQAIQKRTEELKSELSKQNPDDKLQSE